MKVLFTSVYRDGRGYSQGAIDHILSCQAAGLDVVCRPVRMSKPPHNQKCILEDLENKDLQNVDVIIEYCLPHTFEKKEGVKTIGMFDWESSHFNRSCWAESINKMDEIWVPCIQNKYACLNSGVTIPIKILPHSINLKKFDNKPKPLDLPLLKDKCVFLFVGENNRRKNIVGLIRAYYAAFTNKENVLLIIKTGSPEHNPSQSMRIMNKFIQDIKQAVHIHKDIKNYPQIMVITDHVSEEQLAQLYVSSNVFVSCSHGEGGNLGAMDAMSLGKSVILSNWGNHPELTYAQAEKYWMTDQEVFKHPGEVDCGWLIPGQLTYCFGQLSGFNDIYTGCEKWFDADMPAFVDIMQKAYKEYQDGSLNKRGQAAKERVKHFSYEKISIIIKEI